LTVLPVNGSKTVSCTRAPISRTINLSQIRLI
jgi:hypothetical protein